MTDRVVVITGATGELGPIVARRFAEDGDRLALLARHEESCVALAMTLPGGIRRHGGFPVDLADPADVGAVAAMIRERLGPPSVLLHLVGGYVGGTPLVDTADDEWRGQIELNILNGVHAIRAFLPDIVASEHGRIVTVSTPIAAAPTAGHAAYAATKAALEALTISAARDLAGTKATANVVLVRTIGSEKPTHTRPEEIAAAMAWLCTPEAGAISGQRIPLVGRA